MKNTKLISLLKGLTGEDLRQIQKMLSSPFYTTNNNLLSLFTMLRSSHPAFESKKLEKQIVFRKLFPKHDYSDIKLRNLNRDLVRIIEDYLIYREIKSDDFERRKMLAKVYKNDGHTDWFESGLKKLKADLNKLPYRDQIYYKQMMDLVLLQLEFYEGKKLGYRYDLLEAWEYLLDQYYGLSKARHQLALKSLNKIIKPLNGESETTAANPNIHVRLYRQLDELLLTEDLDLFEKTRNDFENHIHLIRPKYQKEFLSLLTNFAIKKMAVDDDKYNKVVLALYKQGLEYKIIFDAEQISDTSFLNIVVCASKAKDFEWTLHFIETYEKYLSPVTKDDIKTLSLSTYYFHKKAYSKAIDLVSAHYFKHAQIKTIAKTHSIRCYYEMYLLDSSYYEVLIAQIESYERYLRRNDSLPEEKLRPALNFLNFISKLATMRLSGKLDDNQQETMIKELSQQQITLSRSWLIDAIKK